MEEDRNKGTLLVHCSYQRFNWKADSKIGKSDVMKSEMKSCRLRELEEDISI